MPRTIRIITYIIFGIILFGAVAIILNRMSGSEEPITELYFENHLSLPRDYIPGAKYLFTFTIHNLEKEDKSYDYEVVNATSGGTIITSKNSFTLKRTKYKTISEPMQLATSSGKTKVEVRLLNKNQSIHFWTDNIYTPKK